MNPERASILDIDTDVQSNRRNKVIEALQDKYGEKKVVRVLTERTEGSKAAILTAARGLEIDVDEAQYIASLIESDRGIQRSLKETYYGNEEKSILPNKIFQNEMSKFPKLWEVAQAIEGLRNGCGVHAGGVIIVDEEITETSSLMKINSGEWVTCFDLHEVEETSSVKIDILATLNLTRMRTCLDLLIAQGYAKKYSTLRETYEQTIGVYNLNRENSVMWEKLANNEILSVFQFDTPQGLQGVSLSRPNSVEEMAALNSIMRLMASEKGAEQPLEKYARFKRNPLLWEEEMIQYNLSIEERKLLHHYLDYEYGICASQEDIMSMIQDPLIGGWSLKDSDMLRKSIAKKDPKLYEELSQKYFRTVEEKKLSKNLCKYFWEVLVNTQRGYSFNLSHTLAYSIIGLQNMNLACNYPIIFWNTANLIVDSSGINENENEEEQNEEVETEEEKDDEEDEDEEKEIEKNKEQVKRAKKTVKYGKTAAAIGKFQSRGIKISPPDINRSDFTFTPIVEENNIIYGLRGITRLSSNLIKEIISGRPYSSFEDFNSRIKTNRLQMINLIKSGFFDSLELNRKLLMKKYIKSISKTKQKLTLQNMQGLIDYEIIPDEVSYYAKLYSFNKFLKNKKSGEFYELSSSARNFIENNFDPDLIYEGTKINQKIWDNTYKKAMEPMRCYLKEHMNEMLESYNNKLVQEQMEKYAVGNISKWEMDSISCYYHEHELAQVNSNYNFANFFDLPEDPVIEKTSLTKKGVEIKIYQLSLIAGTVLEKNKLKNSITLLTQNGVVNVKIYKNQYSLFDKQISERDASGEKHVLEKSWFTKGNLLMIQGIRRGQDFIPKTTKNSVYPIISKIENIDELGNITFKYEREGVE